jgi:uncharacterized membrane-anchored protein
LVAFNNIVDEDQIKEFGIGNGIGSLEFLLKRISTGVWRNYYTEYFLINILKNKQVNDRILVIYNNLADAMTGDDDFSELKFIKQLINCPKEFDEDFCNILSKSFNNRKSSNKGCLTWTSIIFLISIITTIFSPSWSGYQIIAFIVTCIMTLGILYLIYEYFKNNRAFYYYTKHIRKKVVH